MCERDGNNEFDGNGICLAYVYVQFGYLEVTVQETLRSGWPGPFVKVGGLL
jgi:hypothetical protein